jgi:hypothetical protein
MVACGSRNFATWRGLDGGVRRAFLLSVAVWLLAAAPASAETFRVTGPTDVTGTCAATQCASIRQALAAAGLSDGPDRIEIPPGDYLLTQGRLNVDSEVTLVGAGARSTTLRADPQTGDRVFYVNAVAVATISHLTMSGGAGADSSGGNLLNDGGTVALDHVRVTAGRGIDGGGLANLSGVMTVSQSLIDGNSAYQGGGIANTAPSLLPGPRAASSQLTVTDTTIVGNETDYQGGGVAFGRRSRQHGDPRPRHDRAQRGRGRGGRRAVRRRRGRDRPHPWLDLVRQHRARVGGQLRHDAPDQ